MIHRVKGKKPETKYMKSTLLDHHLRSKTYTKTKIKHIYKQLKICDLKTGNRSKASFAKIFLFHISSKWCPNKYVWIH